MVFVAENSFQKEKNETQLPTCTLFMQAQSVGKQIKDGKEAEDIFVSSRKGNPNIPANTHSYTQIKPKTPQAPGSYSGMF